ncbi:MAG: glycosyltransferase [Candidatus Zixiibacteriota bacterium]|nr:MAG: glycosyltransferase [candidate division Zixibacteria bacterium]
MSQVDITVVIVSYNVRSFLDHCLQSVRLASAGLAVQTIVVDNASADDSAAMVAQRYPDVTLIANRENVGFGRANNQAFELARGEAVLVLNPDAFVQEDTLRRLLERLQASPEAGAVGPKIIKPDGRFEPRSKRGFPTPWVAFSYLSGLAALFPRNPRFSHYLLTHLDPDREHEVDALSGCCMMVRRDLLQRLGGFDPDFFMYGEDLDLCYRIHQQGYRIIYSPATRIVHFKGESTRRSSIDHDYHFRRAMRLFVAKNLTGSASVLARGLITLGFWFQAGERRLVFALSKAAFPLADIFILNLLIYLGRWIRFMDPGYTATVWAVNALYSLFYLGSGLALGVYGRYRFSGRRALYAALGGAAVAAAFTYFFQQGAFSRFVVLWFAAGTALAMPGWRLLVRRFVRRPSSSGRRWMRRRVLIVGTDDLARDLCLRLMQDPASDLHPVGYVAFQEDRVGDIIAGAPVLGRAEEMDRIIQTEAIQEVLFSSSEASYDRIIKLIQNLSGRTLDFRIIPRETGGGEDGFPLLRLEMTSKRRRK